MWCLPVIAAGYDTFDAEQEHAGEALNQKKNMQEAKGTQELPVEHCLRTLREALTLVERNLNEAQPLKGLTNPKFTSKKEVTT